LNGDEQLSSVLSEFARTLVTDFPIQSILEHLVERIVDVLEIDAAGVTLIEPGSEPQYLAASDQSALRFEQLQTELGEGPCLAAYESGEAVSVPDLEVDERFPKFGPSALAEGVAAVFTFPLRSGEEQMGALDLYRTTVGALDAHEMSAAQTLADVAAAYLLNARARAELRESTERARQLSLHDDLTGLPNRTFFLQRLDHAILRCKRSEHQLALLFVDLDLFKAVNDTHGHHVGDELLIAVAHRLSGALRPGDTVARFAGDEFVILCEDLVDSSHAEPLAARMGSALSRPFDLSGIVVQITASVGIAFAGPEVDSAEQALQDADAAMYQAKRRGPGGHAVFNLSEHRLATHRTSLSRDLRGALDRGELHIVYQPIVASTDGRILGTEALLRWSHPRHGAVPAATAVGLAEQSGVILEIGRWILEQACLELKRWQDQGVADLHVAVNVSTHQLMAPGFVGIVTDVLRDSGINPPSLTLEMTETVFARDSERALLVLDDLKRLGVLLALDDFGTGYSSLSYLNRFPVDVVKIDRGFIAGLGEDHASTLIVDAVVGLAHGLDLTVVAEGVESEAQHQAVVSIGCDACQGYYFARPAPAVDIEAMLRGHEGVGTLPQRQAASVDS
jgi:diguanylate cyclase (GGDEF)-like protein